MSRYEAIIKLGNTNDSHVQVIDLIGDDKRVLDVGCATGDIAQLLKGRGCRVSGLDSDAGAAEAARAHCDEVVTADLNTSSLLDHFDKDTFDIVVFADVLEHLLDPERALLDAIALLTEGGHVVVSVPNVAHGSVRLALLQGRWKYTDTGLLDRTHIRFFTRASLIELFDVAGLVVDELRATRADPLGVEVEIDGRRIPPTLIEWVRHQPEAMNYQFVAKASRAAPGAAPRPLPTLRPAVPNDVIKVDDEYTAQMNVEQELRLRVLTMRDHIIGLEQRAATAEIRQGKAEAQVVRVKARMARQRRQIREMRESAAWKAGRVVTKPLRYLRRGDTER